MSVGPATPGEIGGSQFTDSPSRQFHVSFQGVANPSGPQFEPSPAEKFFGLAARPFSLTPDLRFSYHSRSHSNALEQVTAALRRREGLIVVTGAIGTGKTMLCRSMLESFEPRTFLSVILDPGLQVEDLLRTVLTDFGIMGGIDAPATGPLPDVSRHQFVKALHQFLSSLVPLQAHAVIMIDEAQRLNPPVLEEIRLLSNFETDEAKLLQIVLVGQPELDELLRKPEMQQLNQRVSRRCELQPLSESEVGDYIERRLTVAASPSTLAGGADTDMADAAGVVRFAPDAVRLVASISRGTPRLVNTLCDRALDVAYERHVRVVDKESVETAANRLRLDVPGELADPSGRRTWWLAAVLVILLLALAATWWWLPKPPDLLPLPGRTPISQAPALPPPDAPQTTVDAIPATAVSPEPAVAATPPIPPLPGSTADATRPSRPAIATSTTTPRNGSGASANGYQITVASFHTEQRASDVAVAVKALRVPAVVRTDSTGLWFRVIAGPFPSRDAAQAAQEQITRGGFEGTQISPIVPEVR